MQTDVQAFQLVETQKALEEFYRDNEQARWMAFDTEFVGEKRFVTRLCLVQAATETGNYLIDPFAIPNLSPFLDLVQNPACIKITHAGDNDYRLLYTLYGITPRNVFDTQIAAGFAGYKHPVAFRKLVEQELGRSLDKGYAVTDWESRPFHKKQLAYALDDVLPLYPIWQRLEDRLRKRDRFHWLEEECLQLENAASYIKDHEQELINSNLMKSLRPKERLFFLRLMTWRRDLAEKKNYSKEMILPERYLAVLARGIASGKEALLHNRRVPDKMIEQHGSLFESFYRQEATEAERALLAQVVSQEDSEDPQEEILLEMLYLLVRHKCLENDISVGMVMPKNLLRRLRADEDAGNLIQGWRKELLGEELTTWLLRINELELHVEGGRLGWYPVGLKINKMPDQKILEIKGLKTTFHVNAQEIRAVDGIDFHLLKGETVGIVGESGSGKSVTALSVMQLVSKPGVIAGGEIRYFPENGDSVNLAALSENEMQRYRGARIAMIFQEPMTSLNPVLRCGEQVAEAIRLHQKKSQKIARQETLNLFKQVQLPDPERIYRAYPHQLSGGQKQRVMIAMALSCKPDILIADEPTTALDVTVQQTILALLNELKRKLGLSVIFISHDLGVIAQIADRALVMYGGKIVEQGRIQELFQHPKHPYTKGLLACRPPLDRRMRRLPVVEDFMEVRQTEAGVELIEKADAAERLASLSEAPEAYQTRQNLLHQQPALLSVQNLSVWFPATRNWLGQPRTWVKAVDEVSFEVLPGETLGLVGESGCGKTTLGRALLHLLPIRSGEIIFEGQALNTLEAKNLRRVRKDIQIVFQDPYASLNPQLTIGQTLLEPLALHSIGANAKERKDRVMALLQSVQLGPEYFQRYPRECSGGQRQRVSIARALASEPRFIVFDESVSALDVSVQAQVLNLLMALREERGFTCIFISHDLSVVKLMSDRLLVMHQGKIVESGYAEAVYAHPKAPYTQQLIGAIPGF